MTRSLERGEAARSSLSALFVMPIAEPHPDQKLLLKQLNLKLPLQSAPRIRLIRGNNDSSYSA
jgi:hypothetical protein